MKRPPLLTTHTYAVLEVSPEAYHEIRQKLVDAGYEHAFHESGCGFEEIDMHGIGLAPEESGSLDDHLPRRREDAVRFEGEDGEIVGVWCPVCREVHDEPTCDQRPLSELSADQLDALRIHEAEKNALQQRNVRRALRAFRRGAAVGVAMLSDRGRENIEALLRKENERDMTIDDFADRMAELLEAKFNADKLTPEEREEAVAHLEKTVEQAIATSKAKREEIDKRFRRFRLCRVKDETGVSGVGYVLWGIVFPSGRVVIEWREPHNSIALYSSFEEFEHIHVKAHPAGGYVEWLQYGPTA